MKLHRLELQAFGPFRDRQLVDFDAFDADGLFLISGRTGAGKSSILDGVCYSLYGTAPRYDGGDRGLRSDHAEPDEPTEASLEFTAQGRRWRVTRTPEYQRPKARGAGMTTQKSTVLLEEQVADAWVGRATKYREAADLLDEILGLNRDQFQQVILLAQNRFAKFLLAGNDDRQALLRTLFGSRRYEEYEAAFEERRRDAQRDLADDDATLKAQLAHAEALVAENDLHGSATADAEPATDDGATATTSTVDRLAVVERAVPRAGYRADESLRRRTVAQSAHDDALAAFGARSALRKAQEARLASRAALAVLEESAPKITADRVRLARARAAETLRATIEAAARLRAVADDAARAEQSARDERTAAGEADADTTTLRSLADDLAGDLAVWTQALDVERALSDLEAARKRADDTAAALAVERAALEEAQVARADRLQQLEAELAQAEAAAPPLEPARAALTAAARRQEAGREAERLAPLAQAADAAHLAAVTVRDRATAEVRTLLQRRLAGYAGELAQGLEPDAPCAVCGSTDHPHPAPPAADPVTDDDVAAAEAAVDAANAHVARASEQARTARAAHHDAAARAGGGALADLEADHAAAALLVEAATVADAVISRAKVELADLRAADAVAAEQREALTRRLVEITTAAATVAQEEASARATVSAARGGYDTVAARIAAAGRRRDLARRLADAADDHARLAQASLAADADLDERLATTEFDDAASATAALIDSTAQAALDDGIRRHEVALATERDRLLALETELAGAPEELVDLTEAAEAASAARDAWNLAVSTAARDAQISTLLADAVRRAAAAHQAVGARSSEYEIISGLANAISGRTDSRMDLETFVLAAELEEIVEAANLRLDAMSLGRYRLQHTDAVGARRVASGLGLTVLDAYTGQARPPQSLSGGETFLASLALALGLAQVVTARSGGVRLDTLFIDEGFGSLDSETLELAMRTLDELRQGGRTVGLISHVEAMKEQLPAQLVVEATRQGPSVIRQDAAIPA